VTIQLEATHARPADSGPAELPALLQPEVRRLLERHPELILELVHGLGSPLHLVFPRVFDEQVRRFQSVLADARVDGTILFAKKANKAHCFAERCAELGVGIDAASAPELAKALGAGVPGARIGVSGPSKSPELVRLALLHGACLTIDSPDELALVARHAEALGLRACVLLRCRPDAQGQGTSRFGLTAAERRRALAACLELRTRIELAGFSFHLGGYSPVQRAVMTDLTIDLCLEARALGFAANVVDIGGGFAVRYVEQSHWAQFLDTRKADDFHARKTFDQFYPYGAEYPGAAGLARILAAPVEGAASLGDKLRRHSIRLVLEPGRALLDQAGITAFRVQGAKDRRASEGYALLTVAGTSFSLSEQWFDSEYLPDPLLLKGAGAREPGVFDACVGGASCLDSDMITWRKIRFPERVVAGDLIVYANTAGYQMDSNESPFHDLPLPRKVVVNVDRERVCWRLDEVAEA
jgi:diaminopimelate decarboxylase